MVLALHLIGIIRLLQISQFLISQKERIINVMFNIKLSNGTSSNIKLPIFEVL